MALGFGLALPVWGLHRRYPTLPVGEAARRLLGRAGAGVAFLYLLYLVVMGGVSLALFQLFLRQAFHPDFPAWLVLAAMAGAAAFGACRGLEAVARCAGCVLVLLVLGTFPAGDFDALFEGTRALPWEQFIPREGRFPVKGHCLNSALHSVPACQSIVKKAAAARLGDAYGLNTLPETGALFQIQFSIMKDTAVLMLDTSGPGLYKRGYRARNMGAPLKETLAAALVTLSRYRGERTPSAIPSAAAVPSPSRRPLSPRTGHRAWTGAFPPSGRYPAVSGAQAESWAGV